MSSKNNLDECKNGKELIHFSKHHGATTRQGKGSHVIVRTPLGSVCVPYDDKDMGKGLRHKIVKAFIALGISVLFIAYIVSGIGLA